MKYRNLPVLSCTEVKAKFQIIQVAQARILDKYEVGTVGKNCSVSIIEDTLQYSIINSLG